tara:strand:+ start:2085 stop:2357 length:273 start_codon:yes stop_codon:yes gene_type:complete
MDRTPIAPILKICGLNRCTELTPYLVVGYYCLTDGMKEYRTGVPCCPKCMTHTNRSIIVMTADGQSYNPAGIYAQWLIQRDSVSMKDVRE